MSKAITRNVTSDTRRSNTAGAMRLAGHLACLAATGTVVVASIGGWAAVPAMLLHGAVLISLFAALHETVHRTAFASRWINDAVAVAIGFIHFLPAGHFRRFHFAHHRYAQDPARDPERLSPPPSSRTAYLLSVSALPYWRDRITELAQHVRGHVTAQFVPVPARVAVIREARWHVALWLGLAAFGAAAGWSWLLWLWAVPTVMGQPLLRLYLMAEHGGCAETGNAWRNTRTVESNAVIRFLMWNMPFHAEHHAYPALPFHALPARHRGAAGRPEVVTSGYAAYHRDLWRSLASAA